MELHAENSLSSSLASSSDTHRSMRYRIWAMVATLVFVGGMAAVLHSARSVAARDALKSEQAFERSSGEVASTLQLAIEREEDLVINASAFVLANPDASNRQLGQWLGSVRAFERYPELQIVAKMVIVPASELPAFAARAGKHPAGALEPDRSFQVVPSGERPSHFFAVRANVSKPGMPAPPAGAALCADPKLLRLLLRARDSGKGSYDPVGRPNELTELGVQVPIYRGGKVPATLLARRAAFVGWMVVGFVPKVVLDRAVRGHAGMAVVFRYHDAFTDASLSSGKAPVAAHSVTMDLKNGWTVTTFGTAASARVLANGSALALLVVGMVLSLLLGVLVLVLATGRARALRLVAARTRELLDQAEDLRTSQERLVQAQKMEAVGQLAGGIAHDFNNLLLVVGSYADFLHESFEEDDPRRIDATEIRRASDRAAALTRQLLTFSRGDVTQPVPIDATATIAGLEAMLRRTLNDKVDLRLELEPELGATLIDAGQFEQIVLNLVLNSQNAMPEGGTLTVRTNAVEIGDQSIALGLAPGAYVAIAVSDTGQGMSEEVRSRALEPFFTTRREVGGSGLGLATVYGIVSSVGGAVTVESALAEGTTVVLYLPMAGSLRPLTTEAGHVRGREDQTVVLVAEDEPSIRALTTRILSVAGYTVLVAASGVEALELAQTTKRIDVLLTDVIMPGMTGGELAETLGRERPGLPIVYMSGYSEQIVAEGVLGTDARYLAKPFKAPQLLELLQNALAQGSLAPAA